jgi:hypothetical protein
VYIPLGADWLERQLQYRVGSDIATTKGSSQTPTSTSNQK